MAGGEGFKVEPDELRGYSGLLGRNAEHFTKIEQHAKSKGGDTSGFTGLLALLVPIVDGVVNLYTDALQSANTKLTKVKSNLDGAADTYQKQETAHRTKLGKIGEQVSAARAGGAS